MKIFELEIDDENVEHGVTMVALVDSPAIKRNWMKFVEETKPEAVQHFRVQDEDKRVVSGPIMVANLPIYRYNEEMGDHYVVFRPDVIERIVLRFFKEKRMDEANAMHDGVKVDGVYLFESFIIDDRKLTPQGFEKLPNGSWFGSFKVENDAVWEQVKNGDFNGFSVEGMFTYATEREQSDELLSKILKVLQG